MTKKCFQLIFLLGSGHKSTQRQVVPSFTESTAANIGSCIDSFTDSCARSQKGQKKRSNHFGHLRSAQGKDLSGIQMVTVYKRTRDIEKRETDFVSIEHFIH